MRPLSVVTPTLDGDVLAALAGGKGRLTGRELGRMIGASQEGVRRALDRLVRQGIVSRERAGNAHLFELNRQHLAARWIEGLALLRLELIEHLRATLRGWKIAPVAAVIFGSTARGDADERSDIDIAVIRPSQTDADHQGWRAQIADLEASTAVLTGNDTRVLEYSEQELRRLRRPEAVLVAAAREGIELYGSRSAMAPARRREKR